jgi:hypothetical protein
LKGRVYMKRLLLFFVASALVLSLFGCGAPAANAPVESSAIISEEPSQAPEDSVEIVDAEETEVAAASEENTPVAVANVELVQSVFNAWKSSSYIYVHAACELKNTGTAPVEVGDISFGLLDKDGGILGTLDTNLPVPEIIQPGEVCFAYESYPFDTIKNAKDIAKIEVVWSADVAEEGQELLSFENLKYYKAKDKYGRPKITGYVINSTSNLADDIRIAFGLYDKDGKLLGVMSQSQDFKLEPGKKAAFTVDYPEFGDKKITDKVTEVKGKAFNWSF